MFPRLGFFVRVWYHKMDEMYIKGGISMNKKLLCGVLSTAVLFGACPATALAEEPLNELRDSLDFRNAEDDLQGDGWYWDANDLTLTLEDFRYYVPQDRLEEKAAIYLPDESYVEIEGDNNVLETRSYHCNAFYCDGEVNFYGDGELEINTKSSGASAFYVYEGPILFDDEVVINVESERGYIIYLKYAKGDKALISIQDEAKISFNKEDHDNHNITLVKKSGAKTYSSWLDYAEEKDEWDDEYINLVARPAVVEPEKETPAESTEPEETTSVNEYQITIGKTDIVKNGEVSYTADVSPYLKNGYTMLPLRALLEVSNPEQQVNWNNGTKSAHTFVNNKLVSIKPGEATYTKALENIALCTPAETVNGRLFVSLRDWMSIMEIDSTQLSWNPETKTVTLKY